MADTNYTSGVMNGAMPSYGGYDPMATYYAANQNIGPAMQNYATGIGVGYAGQLLGNQLGGEWGNVGADTLFGKTTKTLADGTTKEVSNMSLFGTKDFKGFGNAGNLAMQIGAGILDRSTEHQRTSGKYGTVASIADMGGGLIGQFGSYGGYSALGQLGMGAVNKITGGTDGMTVADSLMGSSSLAGGLTTINPGAAYIALSGVNSATGRTTAKNEYNDFISNENLAHMAGSYGKSTADNQDALQYGNKKYGGLSTLFGSWNKANNKVLAANNRRRTMLDIYDRYDLGRIRGADMYDINSLDWNLDRFGGYNQYGTLIGRRGMKLPNKEDMDRIKNILQHNKIDSFKKGGQMNVIPEGALHARLHHMENGDKITKKGIPVVDKSGEQQAEIERDEIIFSLDVTTKLEALRKDGSDKAAIAAGKLLVDEIFNNTDDRTGLIADVIGKDEAKKPVFKQGGIIEIEEPQFETELEVEEPVGIEEVEYYQNGGGILAEIPSLDDIEEYQDGGKTIKHWKKPDNWTDEKIPYEEWVKDVNPIFLSENYDLKSAYENYPKEQLEKWKWSTNQENPEIYLNYNENGYYPYHLGSVVELPNGDYKFLKLGRIEENPELIYELWGYKTNENGLANTHDLVYEGNRYWYKKKKI